MTIEYVEFELKLRGGNQAMVDDHKTEIARLLRLAADKILEGEDYARLNDYNGNKTGYFQLDLDSDDE